MFSKAVNFILDLFRSLSAGVLAFATSIFVTLKTDIIDILLDDNGGCSAGGGCSWQAEFQPADGGAVPLRGYYIHTVDIPKTVFEISQKKEVEGITDHT